MLRKKTFLILPVLFTAIILIINGCCITTPTIKTYSITATAGEGGIIKPEGTITLNEGENQIFTFIPDEGYTISDVLVDGESVGTDLNYKFEKILQNHTIHVTFIKETKPFTPNPVNYYTIEARSDTGGGTINPAGRIKVEEGKDQTFTMIPNECYKIEDVLIDGVSVGVVDTYTFNDIIENHTIAVNFSGRKAYNLDTGEDFDTIQEAIDSTSTLDGHIIVVCPGIYREHISFKGEKTITVKSSNPLDSDIVENTVINGDLDDDGTGDGIVVRFFGNDTSTLRGFKITKGFGSGAIGGGGIHVGNLAYNRDSSFPTIEYNIICDNIAERAGGGICIFMSDAKVKNNIIKDNVAAKYGGGVVTYYSYNSEITDNTIINNQVKDTKEDTGSFGGGIAVWSSDTIVENNVITGNTVTGDTVYGSFGGGIAVSYYGKLLPESSWGSTRENIPILTGDPGVLVPGEGEEYISAGTGNTFLGNKHGGDSLEYTEGAHVYFSDDDKR